MSARRSSSEAGLAACWEAPHPMMPKRCEQAQR
eukprot:CAMPEP_0195585848 /NCGR_PEP_ID=MMETSP0814-20130614/28268_1 /TAXON_ID=97485 /ORGANISM="Prymnesium parvum, Strain Texoma1" /LENGTH=32 /DNA_ID= /DNA_START= /DNA_END= /DNA_ORIENTATION=